MAKPLRSQLNQIRAWVRQGRTDAWIAHQLEVSTNELREFRRRHELSADDEDSAEADLRDEIEAEIEAATREEELAAEAEAEDTDAEGATDEDAGEDGEWLARQQAEALELGMDCVVEVRNEEELELALEQLDPEIFLLAASADADEDALGRALELLPDVPAGKLAVVDVPVSTREQVDELERAGVDAVIIGAQNVAELVRDAPPQV